jgi:hypothetical protein
MVSTNKLTFFTFRRNVFVLYKPNYRIFDLDMRAFKELLAAYVSVKFLFLSHFNIVMVTIDFRSEDFNLAKNAVE